MKKIVLLFIGLLCFSLCFSLACKPKSDTKGNTEESASEKAEKSISKKTDEKIVLKAVSAYPLNEVLSQPLIMFAEEVEKRTNGELVIQVVGGPEIISEFQQHEAVADGRFDFALGPPSYAPGIVKGGEAMLLSVLTPQEERENGAYDFINNEIFKPAGLFYLGRSIPGPGGKFELWTIEPIKSLNDLKGKRMGDGTIAPSGLSELGMIPTTVAWLDMYSALERGIIDGFAMDAISVHSMQWYEVVNYQIPVPVTACDHTFHINLEKWNTLPKEKQELLKNLAIEFEPKLVDYFNKKKAEAMEKLLASGVKIIEIPVSETKKFEQVLYEAEWDKIIERHPDLGPELKKLLSK